MADSRIRFVPSKGFEAAVYREAAGRGRRGSAGASVSSKETTSITEIAEFVANRAQQLASGKPGMPRDTGGLRRARVAGGRVVPYPTYDFRRERSGIRQYQTSFTEPMARQTSGGRLIVTVFNLSPAAQRVEDGTGPEGFPIDPSGRRMFRMPISQRAYRRMNKNMSVAERRARGLISGDPEYRAASKEHSRLLNRGFANTKQGDRGSKASLRSSQNKRLARKSSNSPNAGQIRRQTKGYSRRFVGVQDGRLRFSKTFQIKRRRYIINHAGKAYLGTSNASRYDEYGIFRRALLDAATRYL